METRMGNETPSRYFISSLLISDGPKLFSKCA